MKPIRTIIHLMTLAAASIAATVAMAGDENNERLAAVLAAQPAETQARYGARHPQETLGFFGIAPGMTVVEALPGGGWYTKILLPYLGADGKLIGANYAQDMWPLFGFFSEERIEGFKTWTTDFPADAQEWRGDEGAEVAAFIFGSLPDEMKGTADAVLLVRALHNLARFEDQGGFLTAAVRDAFDVLKPGGIVGVVQHHARDEMPDDWASGANGYLKDDFVIKAFTAAGFEYAGQTDINANPKDQPGESDVVWRLPPSLVTSRDNPELRAAMEAVGESNRMTLKFRKP
jgi:predicted methyltransferase